MTCSVATSIKGGLSQWFNPACSTLQPAGTLGDLGRNAGTGPNFADTDLAALKDTNNPCTAQPSIPGRVFQHFQSR